MDRILTLRPYLPARDHNPSVRFYRALGFAVTLADDTVTILELENISFIPQHYYRKDWAENTMVHPSIPDVDAWRTRADGGQPATDIGVRPPQPPVMQSWGLKVGFMFDPGGVLWHFAEASV